MPSLILFNRRTHLGGDDLQPGSAITILFRLFEFILLIPLILHIHKIIFQEPYNGDLNLFLFPTFDDNDSDKKYDCNNAYYFSAGVFVYVVMFLLFVLISIIFEWNILLKSSVGTPTQPQIRNKKVSSTVEWKIMIMTTYQILLVSLGITGLYHVNVYYYCTGLKKRSDVTFLLLLTLVFGLQCVQTFMSVIYMLHLLRLPQLKNGGIYRPSSPSMIRQRQQQHDYGAIEHMWQRRCETCCRISSILTCCLFGGKELITSVDSSPTNNGGLYSDIARVLTDYFEDGGVLDVVPSDIIAGLVMLQREQMVKRYEARRDIVIVRSTRSLGSTRSMNSDLISRNGSIDNNLSAVESQQAAPTPLIYAQQDKQHIQPRQRMKYIINQGGTSSSYNNLGTSKSTTRLALNPFLDVDRFIMAEATRYVRFALAIYTWMLYVYMHPCKGWMKLGCSSCKCCNRHNHNKKKYGSGCDSSSGVSNEQKMRMNFIPPILIGDNGCHCHSTAFLLHISKIVKQKEDDAIDIIYAQFQNGIAETPYAIVLDHTCKCIVITIRGSLSLEDCVIDAMPDPISLEEVFGKSNDEFGTQYCHSGIYTRTMWIYQDLEEHNLLQYVVEQYSTYMIRVVGHSLGAGCAALLSLMLRERQKYTNLRCLCYSPPGGLFSWELASIHCRSFLTTFVLDTDLVPRLSVENMEYLRNDVLSIIARISVPKIQILHRLVSGVSSIFFTQFTDDVDDLEEREETLQTSNAMLLYPKENIPESTFTRQYAQFKRIQLERKQHRLIEYGTKSMKEYKQKISLYPPGKIVQFVKTGEETSNVSPSSYTKNICNIGRCVRKCVTCGTSNVGSEYSPIYIQNNDLNEILVSPTMGTDHFPNRVCLEIEKVFEKQFCSCSLMGSGYNSEEDREGEIVHLLNTFNDVWKIQDLMKD